MKHILRTTILAMAVLGLLVGGTGTALAGNHGPGPSPACDDLDHASDQADSQADEGLDRAQNENNCERGSPGPIPDPED
jgi:hypothetical protein